jgi:hypothetical protein
VIASWVRSLGNSLYEFSFSFAGEAASTCVLYFNAYSAATVASWAGDGATVNMWLSAASLVAGDCPQSYIDVPSTSTVTRNADSLYYKGDDGNLGGVGSNKRGLLKAKIKSIYAFTLAAAENIFTINDGGSTSDQITVWVDTSGYVNAKLNATGGSERTAIGPATNVLDGNPHTIKVGWKTGGLKVWVDESPGSINGSVTVDDIPDDLDRINVEAGYTLKSEPRIYDNW